VASAEELQRNALALIGSTVKSTPAAAKLDTNQLLFELNGKWNQLQQGNTLDLQPLYVALMARSVAPNDASLVCLLLQKREDRLGMPVKLPPMVATLPERVRAEMVAVAMQKGGAGASAVKLAPVVSGSQNPVRTPSGSGMNDQAPAPRQTTQVVPFSPPGGLKGALGAISPSTIVLCVALIAVAGVVNFMLREKPPEPLKVAFPSSLPKLTAIREAESAFLTDVEKDFQRPDAELEAMAEPLRSVLLPMGIERIYMCRKEDARCRKSVAVVRPHSIMWLDPAIKARKRGTAAPEPAPQP